MYPRAMNVHGSPYRSIWWDATSEAVCIVDQRRLPHEFVVIQLVTLDQAATAIREMWVRGAPLIGVAAAFGLHLGLRENAADEHLTQAVATLQDTRPTAVNPFWALARMEKILREVDEDSRATTALEQALLMADQDVQMNEIIGRHGVDILREISERNGSSEPLNILTHCNAGWLATVDWGTATSPIYQAHRQGIPVHVWVDETRPRNQGASLTAWELGEEGVPHTVIVDNAAGHLMQRGKVDLVITGTDRTTRSGDVCNKIGTYQKALAASDNGVPFYVAAPSSSIDWEIASGSDIPIEERSGDEVRWVRGRDADGSVRRVRVVPENTNALNPAFDVTPARLVTGIITERGLSEASEEGLAGLFG